jgi:hypothetical protein
MIAKLGKSCCQSRAVEPAEQLLRSVREHYNSQAYPEDKRCQAVGLKQHLHRSVSLLN